MRYHMMQEERGMEKKEYGYIRVSTKEQNIDRQLSAMKFIGIQKENIFVDKQSGKDFNRPQYKRLVRKLREGDVMFVKSIDRLGRNYDEIIEQWQYISKVKNADIVVLDFPLLDTRKHEHGITGKFLSDMVLQILSYVAQVERENTKQRQMEGIEEAQKKGIIFGRPKMELPEEFSQVYTLWKSRQITQREASRRLKTNHNTFKNWVERYQE